MGATGSSYIKHLQKKSGALSTRGWSAEEEEEEAEPVGHVSETDKGLG